MNIRTLIIDDEEGARESLNNILNRYFEDIEVVGKAANITEGEALIRSEQPELVFLDIEMPFGNAFDLLERFDEHPFTVIFITAYDQYAIQAIKFSAFDYLLKPIDPDDLKNAVERFRGKREMQIDRGPQYAALIDNLKGDKKAPKRVGIPESDGIRFVTISEISRCESDGNYTVIHLTDGSKILSSKTLGDYETLFESNDFFRIHRSHLINLMHLKKYVKGEGGYVILDDGSEIEVARRKKHEFLEALADL